MYPMIDGQWPQKIKDVLGYPDKNAKTFHPFYYSFDTSY